MNFAIEKIDRNDDVFSLNKYIEDRLSFNYIEGARKYDTTLFYSDKKHIIICKKEKNNSVWIWTDYEAQKDHEAIIAIANVIKNFNEKNLEFYIKPDIASQFSDIYALVSYELDCQVKKEFSLGVYKFTSKKLDAPDDSGVIKYSKKYSDELFTFYKSFQKDFCWSDEKLKKIVDKYKTLNTFMLYKNSELISVCVICDDDGNYSSVRSVVTKHEHRNKGYGTLITNIACCKSEKGGKEKIMLYANNQNKSAITAFKKAGFERTGEVFLIKS